MSARRFHLPDQALSWMVADEPARVLTLGGAGLPRTLAAAGHDVFAIDRSPDVVATLHGRPGITAVVTQAESLPFQPCQFDVVVAHQTFHRFAPGLVLSEMARVLRPGGHAAVSFLVRDDSVPWVRRLVARVRELDPDAMRGDFGQDSAHQLSTSKYFPESEVRRHRHWVPISRREMQTMVGALPVVRGLSSDDRASFLGEVAALYDDAAPGADALRLPYLLTCTKAWVSHAELTAPIEVDDDGLVIPL